MVVAEPSRAPFRPSWVDRRWMATGPGSKPGGSSSLRGENNNCVITGAAMYRQQNMQQATRQAAGENCTGTNCSSSSRANNSCFLYKHAKVQRHMRQQQTSACSRCSRTVVRSQPQAEQHQACRTGTQT
jgi:hypothetical protein